MAPSQIRECRYDPYQNDPVDFLGYNFKVMNYNAVIIDTICTLLFYFLEYCSK